MLTFKSAIGDIELKNSFADLTVRELLFLKGNADNPLIIWSALTGREPKDVVILDLDSMSYQIDFLKSDILDQVEPIAHIKIGESIYSVPEDLGAESFGQKLLACKALSEGDVIEVVAIYLQPSYDESKFDNNRTEQIKEVLLDLDVDAVYSCAKFLSERLEAILKVEATSLKAEVTTEQKRAGIDMFNQLGDFNTIDMLAQGKPWKYKKILSMDYDTIFAKLLHNKISAKFERSYSKIISGT